MAETKIDIVEIDKLQGRLNILIDKSQKIVTNLTDNIKKEKDDNIKIEPKEQSIIINGVEWEYDSSPLAWEYYINFYIDKKIPTEISKKTNCRNKFGKGRHEALPYKKGNDRIFVYVDKNLNLKDKYNDTDVSIAGDCCFNFNEKKIGIFARIVCLEKNLNVRIKIMTLLCMCNELHHSPLNFALMPTNGGAGHSFNNKKANIFDRNDRLDSFLCYLEKDFNNDKRPKALKEFLEAIDSFENYLGLFYPEIHENEELKKKITETGDMKIEDCNSLLAYIDTAISFWKAKLDYYNKQNHKES